MAFPASTVVPAFGYITAKQRAHALDLKVQEWIGLLAAPVDFDTIWSWYGELYACDQYFAEVAAIDGIREFAIEQETNLDLDIVAEFQAMRAAIQAAGGWIYNAIPRDANGYALVYKTSAAHELLPRSFATAGTAPLIPLLQAVDAAIG